MMWGNGYGMGFMWWVWPVGLVLVLGVVLLTIVTIRVFSNGSGSRAEGPQGNVPSGPVSTGRSVARLLLDERFARGELDAEEYRHRVQVLGE
jgi:putative membrane protein